MKYHGGNLHYLESISSMFYARILLYKILSPKITKLYFGFEILAPKISYEKCAHKMLMKLTPSIKNFAQDFSFCIFALGIVHK